MTFLVAGNEYSPTANMYVHLNTLISMLHATFRYRLCFVTQLQSLTICGPPELTSTHALEHGLVKRDS
jgi:hypothetical protein